MRHGLGRSGLVGCMTAVIVVGGSGGVAVVVVGRCCMT